MERCTRPAEPEVLRDHGARWNARFAERRAVSATASFAWPQHEGVKLNHLLLPLLKEMTDGHCAYCDAWPVEGVSNETIDHFEPKSAEPGKAHTWTNLFYACDACQGQKLETPPGVALRPDDRDYAFERFFQFNFKTGEIEVAADLTGEERVRAEATRQLFGLNECSRPTSRLHQLREWRRGGAGERRAYRFIERVLRDAP